MTGFHYDSITDKKNVHLSWTVRNIARNETKVMNANVMACLY